MSCLYCTVDTILPGSGETPNKLIEFSAKSKDVSKNSVPEINKSSHFKKPLRTSLDLHINFVLHIGMKVKKWGKPQIMFIIMEKHHNFQRLLRGRTLTYFKVGLLLHLSAYLTLCIFFFFLFPIYRPLNHWFPFVVCGFVKRVLQTNVSLSLDLRKFYNCLSIYVSMSLSFPCFLVLFWSF